MKSTTFVAVIVFAMSVAIAYPMLDSDEDIEEYEQDSAASDVYDVQSLPLEDNVPSSLFDLASLPRDSHTAFNSYSAPLIPSEPIHAAVEVAPAASGISVDKHVLIPNVEIFRFIETFIRFKNQLIASLKIILNENWDLVRAVLNLVLGKIQKLGAFTLTGINVLRRILEFALSIFGSWSVHLPSVHIDASANVQPTYGVPDILTVINGLL